MGVKMMSLSDREMIVRVRGGVVTVPSGVLLSVEPELARELERIAPVRKVPASDPAYSDMYTTITVTEA